MNSVFEKILTASKLDNVADEFVRAIYPRNFDVALATDTFKVRLV